MQLDKYYDAKNDAEREAIILNPWEIFHKALNNCKPILETMPIKRGGTTYAVPVPIKDTKATFVAMRWLIDASKDKDGPMRFHLKLAYELMDAANDTVNNF